MSDLDPVRCRILEIFLECFDLRIASPEADLLETRMLDSLRIVDLVLGLEQRFGVSLPFEELEIEDFRTVTRIAERVRQTAAAAA
jgi:acyl carrier protein